MALRSNSGSSPMSGDRPRYVSARVTRVEPRPPMVAFPHLLSDAGESLGSDAFDAAVRDRAEQVVTWLDAAAAFRRWKESN